MQITEKGKTHPAEEETESEEVRKGLDRDKFVRGKVLGGLTNLSFRGVVEHLPRE